MLFRIPESLVEIHPAWLGILALAFFGASAGWLGRRWYRYRQQWVITCPDNQRRYGVRVDAGRAAFPMLGSGKRLRLRHCSRWPEKAGCGQDCVTQIEHSPKECLVRQILTDWFAGTSCAMCGRPFHDVEWTAQKPGLLRTDGAFLEWPEISADKLHETLETALPVCFTCHLANTLVCEHPDLVTDRSRRLHVQEHPQK